jgi:N-acetylglucosamine kinase-like BadF-type ATPase
LHDSAGSVLARACTGPYNPCQDGEGGLRAVAAAWRACCTAAGLDPDRAAAATCLSAGLAGVNAGGAAERFHAALAGFAQRRLASDGHTALIGAFKGAAVARERRPSPVRGAWLIGTGRAAAALPTAER